MQILAIMGSNHASGYTREVFDYLLNFFQKDTIHVVDMSRTEVKPCIGCNYCLSHQDSCILTDDEMTEIYEQIRMADLIILVSPVYFCSFPSKLKALIDRCQMFFNLKDRSGIKKKAFAAVHIGGSRPYPDQFAGIKGVYRYWLSDFRAELIGTVDIPSTDYIDPLQEKKTLAKIDELVTKVKEGKNHG